MHVIVQFATFEENSSIDEGYDLYKRNVVFTQPWRMVQDVRVMYNTTLAEVRIEKPGHMLGLLSIDIEATPEELLQIVTTTAINAMKEEKP